MAGETEKLEEDAQIIAAKHIANALREIAISISELAGSVAMLSIVGENEEEDTEQQDIEYYLDGTPRP